MPRVVEAMASYWKQIGLDAKITIVDQIAYNGKFLQSCKTAGEISLHNITSGADPLDKATLHLMPGGQSTVYQDEASYVIYKEGFSKISFEEHQAYGEKLNQYYFDNYVGVIAKTSFCYAWNPDKIAPFPHAQTNAPYYLEYIRHAKPLDTFRLFSIWPGR